MNKLFRIAAVALMTLCGVFVGNAQIFNHLGAGVSLGTNGLSVDLATPITSFVNLRAGVDILEPGLKFSADADYEYNVSGAPRTGEINLDGKFGRVQGHVIFNVYPVPKVPFFVAAGAYFGGDRLVKITGHSDELAGQSSDGYAVIGDYRIPVDPEGNVRGGLKVSAFRPYLGIGWGRAIPNKLLNFGVELGVQFHGTPDVYTDYGEIDKSLIYDDDNTFNKIRKSLTVYPVLSFKLNFRAF